MNAEPALTVVIPTRDRPALLEDCLRTIGAQDRLHSLDVLIIDDGSRDPLADILAAMELPPSMRLRVERQEPAGLNAARNRALELAHAELVAFLDDDTLADRGWASAVVEAFESTRCAAIGGRVSLVLEGTAPRWLNSKLRRYLAEFEHGAVPRWLDDDVVPVGANCAVRRKTALMIGGFRDGLDRSGASLVSNGDTEFFRRLRATGHPIRYAPQASVGHRVPAERLTREFFHRRAYAQGVSDGLLADLSPRDRRGQASRELVRFGRAAPIMARGVIAGRGVSGSSIWCAYCCGRLGRVRSGPARSGTRGTPR